jgi:hypothetical protein
MTFSIQSTGRTSNCSSSGWYGIDQVTPNLDHLSAYVPPGDSARRRPRRRLGECRNPASKSWGKGKFTICGVHRCSSVVVLRRCLGKRQVHYLWGSSIFFGISAATSGPERRPLTMRASTAALFILFMRLDGCCSHFRPSYSSRGIAIDAKIAHSSNHSVNIDSSDLHMFSRSS